MARRKDGTEGAEGERAQAVCWESAFLMYGVIPVKVGIQAFQGLLDSRFRGSDFGCGLFRILLVIAKDRVQMKTAIGFFSGILLIFWSSSAVAETAQEMLSACRPIARANLSAGKGKVTGPDTFTAGKCWGAFTVIQSGIERVDDRMLLIYNICPPAQSTKIQLIAMFVDYAEKNPQRLQEDFFDVFIDALRKSFPCKPEKGKGGGLK